MLSNQDDTGCLQKTHWRSSTSCRKVWWLDNGRSQSSQRRTWISEQSSIRSRGARSCHSMDAILFTRRKRVHESFLSRQKSWKSLTLTIHRNLSKSCEDLSWNHRTSTPHRSDTNGIAERAARRPKEGTSAVLLQSGLDEKWWADSIVEISLPFRAASLEQSAVREEPLRWEIHCWQCPMRYELIGRPIRILGGTSTAGFGEWVYFLDNMWDPGWQEARLLIFHWQGSQCNPQQVLPESWSANLCFCTHTSTTSVPEYLEVRLVLSHWQRKPATSATPPKQRSVRSSNLIVQWKTVAATAVSAWG